MGVAIRSLTPAVLAASIGLASCRGQSGQLDDHGIPPCPVSAASNLLSTDALECWFNAAHGRWRTVSHQEVYGALVVQVEALDLKDAEEIARRFIDGKHESLSEISVYVQGESSTAGPSPIRRIRWTPDAGYQTLDFTAPAKP